MRIEFKMSLQEEAKSVFPPLLSSAILWHFGSMVSHPFNKSEPHDDGNCQLDPWEEGISEEKSSSWPGGAFGGEKRKTWEKIEVVETDHANPWKREGGRSPGNEMKSLSSVKRREEGKRKQLAEKYQTRLATPVPETIE